MWNLIILVFGIFVGFLVKKNRQTAKIISFLVFSFLIPYILITEFSSIVIANNWYLFLWGTGFVITMYFTGRLLGMNLHKAALLGTAEGGTIGFAFYLLLGTNPIAAWLLMDQMGNGGTMFTFIYSKVTGKTNIKGLINPVMVSLVIGLILNILGVHLKDISVITAISPWVNNGLLFLISAVIGTGLNINFSTRIICEKTYLKFWITRAALMTVGIIFRFPLPVIIFSALPSSFLLPVMYSGKDKAKKEYATNFIAASLPVSVILLAVIYFIYH